jgi:ligand-binding SRPBCC domain-containing protein
MSRRRTLQSLQWVPYAIDRVWALASDPSTLEQITPPHYGASVSLQSESFQNGSTVVIRMKPYGVSLPLNWVSKIQDLQTEGDRRQFVDVQVSGPFAYWKHRHRFESGDKHFHGRRSGHDVKIDNGGTWIIDEVEYEMPYGLLGLAAEKIFARRQLESMFAYRKRRFLEILKDA